MTTRDRLYAWLRAASFSEKDGCRHPQDIIAAALGVSDRTIIRCVQQLEEQGRIRVHRPRRRGLCNTYWVDVWTPSKRSGVLNVLRSVRPSIEAKRERRQNVECHPKRTTNVPRVHTGLVLHPSSPQSNCQDASHARVAANHKTKGRSIVGKAQNCLRCKETKTPADFYGSHRRLCIECITQAGPQKQVCKRCNETKWPADFDGSHRRLCIECIARTETAECKHCGEWPGLDASLRARKYCAKAECQTARASRLVEHNQKEAQKRAGRKRKRCPACAQLLDIETAWRIEKYYPTGLPRFAPYCKSCIRAISRQKYLSNEHRRVKARERAKRQREEIRERRAVDPVFNAEYLARATRWRRASYERRRNPDPKPVEQGRKLPSAPLAEWLRCEVVKFAGVREMSKVLRYDDAGLHKIMWGKVGMVHANAVDRILTNAGVPHLCEVLYGESW